MANGKSWFFQNIANAITIFGLILSVWLVLIAIIYPGKLWLITLLAALIGFTDYLDGKVARCLNIKSVLGGALDRLRDKLFICPTLVVILYYYWDETFRSFLSFTFAIALVVIVISLECLLMFVWIFGLIKKWNTDSNWHGKVKMTLEIIVVLLWLVSIDVKHYFNFSLIRFSIYLINFLLIGIIYYAIRSLDGYYQRYVGNNKKAA